MVSIENRSFLGALAAAIVSFCKAFIRAMTVAEEAVAMAEKSVKKAREKQTIDLAISGQDYATRAREQSVLRQVKQEKAMREYIANDPDTAAMVKKARETIDQVIARELAELHQVEE